MQDIPFNVISKPKTITLNTGQQEALDGLLSWVKDDTDTRHACLIGQAGVGKSFLTALFLKECQDLIGAYAIQATSTTHKASGVLDKFMKNNDLSVIESGTIHSYLKMTLQRDGKTKKLKRGGRNKPKRVKLLVVEEASMIPDDLYKYILEDYGVYFDKLLFIGDKLQLPPVNNIGESKAFDSELQFELTEIVRQASDNPIISLGDHLRRCILESKKPELKTDIVGSSGVLCMGSDKFDRLMFKSFDSPDALNDPDTCRTIAWTNAQVESTNRKVKQSLFGDDYERYNIGDTVMAYQAVLSKAFGVKTVEANNCEEFCVLDVQFGPHPIYSDIDCDILHLKGDMNKEVTAYVVCEDDQAAYNKVLNKYAKAKKWNKFYDLKEYFDIIEPAYSLTSHKSQGSSFKNVFVNERNMRSILDMRLPSPCNTRMLTNKEKLDTYLRCLYVGVTRATDRAYILN